MTAGNPSEQLVGAVLNGRWRLVRLLGEGGMGAVYEADGTRGEGKRAIKLLHQEYVQEEQVLHRFFTEAQANRALQHPNIAQVFEAATAENGTPYLVMELLQGSPLASYTDQGQTLPPAQAVALLQGVLQALALAHTRRIIHRDLKPDNIFLVRDASGQFQAKVLDFGIAKVMDLVGGMGQKTRTGVLLGTPGYMSPEQIKNSKAVDARTDLWAIGTIFYELLTGKPPFPADNEFARLTSVLTEEVKPIEQVVPQFASWGPFIRKALAKEPAQRFQTAEEMAQAMTNTLRGGASPSQVPPANTAPSPGGYGTAQSPAHSPPAARAPQPSLAGPNATIPITAMPQGALPPLPSQQSPHLPPLQSKTPPGIAATVPQSPVTGMGGYTPAPPAGAARPAVTVPSAPPPPLHGQGGIPTHVSQQRPLGMPPIQETMPHVPVVGSGSKGAPWWVVGVVGAICLGVGFLIGFLAA